MGWALWLLLTALAGIAGYLVAVATYPDRGALDRLVVSHLVALSLILVVIPACGLAKALSPLPLGLCSFVLFSVTAFLAFRAVGRERVIATLRADLDAPFRTFRDAYTHREPAVLALVPALLALAVTCLVVWFYKSWTWDPVWYHVPMTSYAIQEHSLRWIDTNDLYLQGYARNVELLAAWNGVFTHDARFDDASQIPFATLGALVVAAWARREGASRPLAAGLGAAWFALPPVFLQAYTTHTDVAVGALFPAAIYYMRERPTARDRWMCLIAMGLYVGTKFTGVFHLALIAPWIAVRAVLEFMRPEPGRSRRRIAIDVSLSLLAFAATGLWKYVQNAVHTGNPMYPFRTTIPLIHKVLPGPQEVGALWNLPPGTSPYFFGAPHDLERLFGTWFDFAPFFAPDVKQGAFGPLFRWILLPCVLILFADAVRLRSAKRSLPVIALFVLGLVVPSAWWPRFIIPSASASLVACAMVHGELPRRGMRIAFSCAIVLLCYAGYRQAYPGFIAFPQHFREAVRTQRSERAGVQLDTFHWPTEWGLRREREMRPGDVVIYDDAASFLQEFFTHDYRTRVVFVSSERNSPQAFVARARALGAKWIGVRAGSAAEAELRAQGAEFLFHAPLSEEAVYRGHWGR